MIIFLRLGFRIGFFYRHRHKSRNPFAEEFYHQITKRVGCGADASTYRSTTRQGLKQELHCVQARLKLEHEGTGYSAKVQNSEDLSAV